VERDRDFGSRETISHRPYSVCSVGVLASQPNFRTLLGVKFYRSDLAGTHYTHLVFIYRQNRFIKQAPWEIVIFQFYDFGSYHYDSKNFIWKRDIERKHQELKLYIFNRLSIHLEHVHRNYFGLPNRNNPKFANLGDVELDQMHYAINLYWATVINRIAVDFIAGVDKKTVKGIILDGQ
jgi:hypothetical protein